MSEGEAARGALGVESISKVDDYASSHYAEQVI